MGSLLSKGLDAKQNITMLYFPMDLEVSCCYFTPLFSTSLCCFWHFFTVHLFSMLFSAFSNPLSKMLAFSFVFPCRSCYVDVLSSSPVYKSVPRALKQAEGRSEVYLLAAMTLYMGQQIFSLFINWYWTLVNFWHVGCHIFA